MTAAVSVEEKDLMNVEFVEALARIPVVFVKERVQISVESVEAMEGPALDVMV